VGGSGWEGCGRVWEVAQTDTNRHRRVRADGKTVGPGAVEVLWCRVVGAGAVGVGMGMVVGMVVGMGAGM
jgi:hypothetical protein